MTDPVEIWDINNKPFTYFTVDTTSRTYIFRTYNENLGCIMNDTTVVTIYPRFNLSLGADTSFLSETSTYLKPSINFDAAPARYIWTLPPSLNPGMMDLRIEDVLNDPTLLYPIFDVNVPREIDSLTFRMRAVLDVPEQCTETDEYTVTIIRDLLFANAFSPNADGINDYWILHPALTGKVEISIFNRWGEKVYYDANYQNDWDGTRKGKELPMGTYYYVATIKVGEPRTIKGTITIVR
jgi:gliding motility-associated-like protein